jgi:hypothetical protein
MSLTDIPCHLRENHANFLDCQAEDDRQDISGTILQALIIITKLDRPEREIITVTI